MSTMSRDREGDEQVVLAGLDGGGARSLQSGCEESDVRRLVVANLGEAAVGPLGIASLDEVGVGELGEAFLVERRLEVLYRTIELGIRREGIRALTKCQSIVEDLGIWAR